MFRLESIFSIKMVLFDKDGVIKKYSSPLEIIEEFFPVRMEYYSKRKEAHVKVLLSEAEKLTNKAKFCNMVLSGELKLLGQSKSSLVGDLITAGFTAGYLK